MASHVLSFKNQEEFFQKIKDKDRDLIVKMVKTVLYAIKHKKPKVDVFEVIFTDVKYYRERCDGNDDPQCTIGPYSFDCLIPRDNKPGILIECQGDYWHSMERAIRCDAAKASYIANNFDINFLF